MDELPRRPRRLVSPRAIAVLRALGYRYSYNREAWVHRLGGGRFGPVFTEDGDLVVAGLPSEIRGRIDEQLREPTAVRMAPVADLAVRIPPSAARRVGDRLLPVRWTDGDAVTTVYVDGRPPTRDLRPPVNAERAPLPRRDARTSAPTHDRTSAAG